MWIFWRVVVVFCVMSTSGVMKDEERSEGYEGDDHSPASRVRQRYEKMFKEREERGSTGSLDAEDEAARAAAAARDAANAAARTAFHGVISSVFTKHLRCVRCMEESVRREDLSLRLTTWPTPPLAPR